MRSSADQNSETRESKASKRSLEIYRERYGMSFTGKRAFSLCLFVLNKNCIFYVFMRGGILCDPGQWELQS